MASPDDPYLRIPIALGQIRILIGGEDPDTMENTDGFVDHRDGTTRSFTVLTLAEVDRVMRKWERSGECLSGAHFRVPDLVIVRTGGVQSIVNAVEDLADELPVIELDDGR